MKHRNHTSLHVEHADGQTTRVEVYNRDGVASQLLTVLGRVLGAYRAEIQADMDRVLEVQRLLDDAGLSVFLGRLGQLWQGHPSQAGEPPAGPDYLEWPGSLGDQLREVVAAARGFGFSDDDVRAALEEAMAEARAGDHVPDDSSNNLAAAAAAAAAAYDEDTFGAEVTESLDNSVDYGALDNSVDYGAAERPDEVVLDLVTPAAAGTLEERLAEAHQPAGPVPGDWPRCRSSYA